MVISYRDNYNYMVTVNIFLIETTTIIWLQLTYFFSRQLQLTNLIKWPAPEALMLRYCSIEKYCIVIDLLQVLSSSISVIIFPCSIVAKLNLGFWKIWPILNKTGFWQI